MTDAVYKIKYAIYRGVSHNAIYPKGHPIQCGVAITGDFSNGVTMTIPAWPRRTARGREERFVSTNRKLSMAANRFALSFIPRARSWHSPCPTSNTRTGERLWYKRISCIYVARMQILATQLREEEKERATCESSLYFFFLQCAHVSTCECVYVHVYVCVSTYVYMDVCETSDCVTIAMWRTSSQRWCVWKRSLQWPHNDHVQWDTSRSFLHGDVFRITCE